jgi:threonine dehydrogenase-like Zn-dependent dehydrogenase/NADP-dependent 3-hydroxy acid dehydrogenase YdfG
MRAAVTTGHGAMEVVEVAEPAGPGPGELLLRPEAVGLCGSDFHYFHGHLDGVAYPRIQGHEFSAIVAEAGAGSAAAFAPGQRVAVWPVSSCGECYACRIGRDNACERISLIGIHSDGALREQLTVPAAQAFAVDDLDARLTAFIEPTSIAVRTVVRGRVAAGERVLVLGAGPIGQAVAIAALDRGASVLVADRIASRLELARAFGCAVALLEPGDDVAARARAWAGGEAPEVVVEATGAVEPMRAALDAVAQAGRVLVVGLSTHEVPLRVGALPFRELDVLGVSCCKADDFAAAAALVKRWEHAVAPLISHDFALADAPGAMAYAGDNPAEVMKAVVHPMSATSARPATRLFDVEGVRALVTGAASGIGQAFAEVLADSGARVTLADIDAERLALVVAELEARGGDVRGVVVDVSDAAAVDTAFAGAVAAHGGLDVAFANAGIAAVPGFGVPGGQELHTVADDVWQRVLALNQHGVLYTMRAAAAVMKRQGSGRIVVTASTAGLSSEPLVCYGYAASKAAVIGLARHAALELAQHGVHVNVIAPGPFKTRIAGGVDAEGERVWSSLVPLGRMGDTEELKGLALLLASPASSFITGAVIPIDGGQLLGKPGEW